MIYWLLAVLALFALLALDRALRAERELARLRARAVTGSSSVSAEPSIIQSEASRPFLPDPGKQALEMLRRGDNCDWYSIKRNDHELHEGFDCLEIYWRTKVDVEPTPGGGTSGYHRFEDRAGFRVRWHIAATNHSYAEAYGIDLLETILAARELADRYIERARAASHLGYKHAALEAWKGRGPDREYGFHGLDLEKWLVRLEYPGGLAWHEDADLDQAAAGALAKAPP